MEMDSSQLEMVNSPASTARPVGPGPVGGRCDACKKGHNKCDGATPVCGMCAKRGRECSYSRAAAAAAAGVVRSTPSSARRGSGVNATAPGSACLPCRKGKRKCDQERPNCGPCTKRQIECVYGSTLKRPRSGQIFGSSTGLHSSPAGDDSGRARKYARLSHDRPAARMQPIDNGDRGNKSIQRVRTSRSVTSSMRDASSSISDNESERGEKRRELESSPPLTRYIQQREEEFHTPPPHPALGQQRRDVPSSVQLASHRNGEESEEEVDGKVEPFMAGLKQAILQRTDGSKPGTTADSRRELERLEKLRKEHAVRVTPDPKDMVLPDKETAQELISDYLTREYVNLPIVNLGSFQPKYLSIWTEEGVPEDNGVFRATLNIMLALASLALSPSNRDESSTYFVRAQKLLRLGGLEGEDIGHIQAYVLASQYLLAVNNLSAAWKSIGMAISTAQSLRLHLNSGSQHHRNRNDRELGRRLWHSCIIMQRTIALNMGSSPQVTPASKTPLPVPLESDFIDTIFGGKPEDSNDRPSIIEFFNALARLYERYDDILSIQSDLRLAAGRSPLKVFACFDPKPLLETDRLLTNWKLSLPPYLQPTNDSHPSLKNPIACRQHNIIRIRYLHMRLLLWRPFLALAASCPSLTPFTPSPSDPSTLQHSIDSPLSHTILHTGAIKAILAARELIDTITSAADSENQNLDPVTPWWENVNYAFSCATAFVAAKLCDGSVREELPDEGYVERGWRRSVRLLEEYAVFSGVAGRCVEALEGIAEGALGDGKVSGEDGKVRDVSWLECLPVDLGGRSEDEGEEEEY